MENLLQKNVGNRIKEIRAEKNISQQELADLCGFEGSNMSRLEAGRVNVTLSTLQKVADALGVKIIELFRF